eukprot:98999-Chlamydomonas_euryale.AAC.1
MWLQCIEQIERQEVCGREAVGTERGEWHGKGGGVPAHVPSACHEWLHDAEQIVWSVEWGWNEEGQGVGAEKAQGGGVARARTVCLPISGMLFCASGATSETGTCCASACATRWMAENRTRHLRAQKRAG